MKIHMIIGSTREGRIGAGVADRVEKEARAAGHEIVRVDLKDHALPFVDSALPPMMLDKKYPHESVQEWSKLIDGADAFIIVTPEYNHGYPAALKNALDWLYGEWSGKPVGIVSYSMAPTGGSRSAEQLKLVLSHLGLKITQAHTVLPSLQTANGDDIDDRAIGQLTATFEQIVDLSK